MEIKKFYGLNEKDVNSKKSNILVPICVGNKFFLDGIVPTENTRKYIDWALRFTSGKVLVIIVDRIQISNWIVRNTNISFEMNMRRLLKRGKAIRKNFVKIIEGLSENDKRRIAVIRWDDYYDKDLFCKKTTRILYEEFERNNEFRGAVLSAVKLSVKDRVFTEDDYLILCKYVLDEFSLVYHGVDYDGVYYGLYVYPYTDEVLEFVESIKNSDVFVDLSERLSESKTFVVLLK